MIRTHFFGLGLSGSSLCGSGEKPIRHVVAFLFIAGMGQLWQDERGLQLANQVDRQTRKTLDYDFPIESQPEHALES